MIHFPSLLALMTLSSPWHLVGLVAAVVIALIPLCAVLGIYFKLASRPLHKPLERLPLSGQA